MAVWPASLPQKQFTGLTDQRQDARVRTEMDAGLPKMRRRFTAALRTVTTRLVLTGTQRQTFDTFYITTLSEGVDPFDWEDPVTDATVSFRFIEPPQWSLIVGGSTSDRLWEATLSLELLP